MNGYFCIGDFHFQIICPDIVPIPENFMKFSAEPVPVPYLYTIVLREQLPEPEGDPAARRDDILVFRRGSLETRYQSLHGGYGHDAYACMREDSDRRTTIFLRPQSLDDMRYDTFFTSLFSLERRLIDRDALILHSSYIQYKGLAILFSAPSQTGKSTQAGLWEQYRGVRQINGDRSLLRQIGGIWYACGWPVCGSSEICCNEQTPIRAIIMLSQGSANEVRPLSQMQAFSQIYTQVTINRWNRSFQTRAMDRIEALVQDIPVYHLTCTISREAVDCLAEALQIE